MAKIPDFIKRAGQALNPAPLWEAGKVKARDIALRGSSVVIKKAKALNPATFARQGIKKLHGAMDHFSQTINEGHYHAEPVRFWDLLLPKKGPLPETAKVAVASELLSTSTTVGKRFLWLAVFAMLSSKMLVAAAVGFVVTGAGLMALEYRHCKRKRVEVLIERNFAGQEVEGTRADLCRLHIAQDLIIALDKSFKQASRETTEDTIRNLEDSVGEERRRVKIIDAGPYGASNDLYEFSRPEYRIVRSKPAHGDKIKFQEANLRKTFNREIIDRLVAIQVSLPSEVQEEIKERLKKETDAVPVKPLSPPAQQKL